MISAIEAVIQYLRRDAELSNLVGEQIASKHQFGSGWDMPSKAVQVRYDGGAPDLYVAWQTPRLEVRCYGESQYECDRVYREIVRISRAVLRETVETDGGDALIYWLNLTSGPSFFRDPDVEIDVVLVFAEAAVAEESTS